MTLASRLASLGSFLQALGPGCWYPARIPNVDEVSRHWLCLQASRCQAASLGCRVPSSETTLGPPGQHEARVAPRECPAAPRGRFALHRRGGAPHPSIHCSRPPDWPAPSLQGRPAANRGRGAELRDPPDALNRCGPTRSAPLPLGPSAPPRTAEDGHAGATAGS